MLICETIKIWGGERPQGKWDKGGDNSSENVLLTALCFQGALWAVEFSNYDIALMYSIFGKGLVERC